MDPAPSADPSTSKRPLEDADDAQLASKRLRWEAELKRVAEIVLVLSTMARMRGGRKPTDAEVELMAEARGKLVELCGNVAPKDIVDKEAVGRVIEDLGLNSTVQDQKLGFSAPKLTIVEKMAMSKRKMEESKKFTASNAAHISQKPHASTENRGKPLAGRAILSDKPGSLSVAAATPSTAGRAPGTPSTSVAYHMPAGEVKTSVAAGGFPGNHLVRDSPSSALPRAERTQGGTNGLSYSSQVQASSSVNHLPVNAPSWSVHPQSALSAKFRPDNKAATHASVIKVDTVNNTGINNMSGQVSRDQTCRPFITQSVSGSLPNVHQPISGMNVVQTPAPYNHHSEISKSIQKVLKQNLPSKPPWTPPSRDYMSTALPCQICKLTVNEVDTVLICDACEKGYHLKCIHLMNVNGIPKGEWHCMKCVSLSNGKPLPPKYGRVMRNTSGAKVPPSSGAVQSSDVKKPAALEVKVNQQNMATNDNPGLQGPSQTAAADRNNFESSSNSKAVSGRQIEGNDMLPIRKDNQQGLSETCPNNSVESDVRSIQQSQNLAFSTNEGSASDPKSGTPCNAVSNSSGESGMKSIQQSQNLSFSTNEGAVLDPKPGTPCNAVSAASSNPQDVKTKPPCNAVSVASTNQQDIKGHPVNAELS